MRSRAFSVVALLLGCSTVAYFKGVNAQVDLFLEPDVSTQSAAEAEIAGMIPPASVQSDSEGKPLLAVATVSPGALAATTSSLSFSLPGAGPVLATLRGDVPQQIPAGLFGTNEGLQVAGDGPLADEVQWVGEMEGFPGPQSVVIFNADRAGLTYGLARWVDLATGTVYRYVIQPLAVAQADGTVALVPNKVQVFAEVEVDKPRHYRTRHTTPGTGGEGVVELELLDGGHIPLGGGGAAVGAPNRGALDATDLAAAAAGAAALQAEGDAATATAESASSSPGAAVAAGGVAADEAEGVDAGGGGQRRLQQLASVTHDLLVLYTQAAANRVGGDTAIRNQITQAVAMANKAYADSKIDLALFVVAIVKVTYTESTGDQSLEDLAGDGVPNAKALREQYGADLVTMFTDDDKYCGIAYMCRGNSYGTGVVDGCNTWSVVMRNCYLTYTTAHELGHSQGCGHNVEDGRGFSLWGPYAFGYRRCVAGAPNNFQT